ncbi:DUF2461 domain-containing protein [Frateuria aurantia]
MSTTYFSRRSFQFLDRLARHNQREWFHQHRADYERDIREPFQRLITDLQAPLAAISPHLRADPRKVGGSLFRIHRDTRFAHDKDPYKTWQGARFFHERHRQIQAPSYYVQIQPGECFAGGGIWSPESATLKTLREFLADNPAAWKRATHSADFKRRFVFWGESLKRPPRGYEADHELIDDLKRKHFAAGRDFDEALACSDELLPWLVEQYRALAPMMDYLCAARELEF